MKKTIINGPFAQPDENTPVFEIEFIAQEMPVFEIDSPETLPHHTSSRNYVDGSPS